MAVGLEARGYWSRDQCDRSTERLCFVRLITTRTRNTAPLNIIRCQQQVKGQEVKADDGFSCLASPCRICTRPDPNPRASGWWCGHWSPSWTQPALLGTRSPGSLPSVIQQIYVRHYICHTAKLHQTRHLSYKILLNISPVVQLCLTTKTVLDILLSQL